MTSALSGALVFLTVILALTGRPAQAVDAGAGGSPYVESHATTSERREFVEKLRRAGPPSAETAEARLFVEARTVQKDREEFTARLRSAGPNKRPLYEQYIDVIGANGILDGIERVWPKCHDQAHDLGKVIYERVQDIGRGLRVCADQCYSGCMHGVLMEAFSLARDAAPRGGPEDAATLRPIMNHLCSRDPEDRKSVV